MENLVIIKSVAAELEAGNPLGAADYFADDFVYSGPAPEHLGKSQFLALMAAIKEAFPDWSWGFNAIMDMGNVVKALRLPHGTHTGEFSLPGLKTIPPTGTRVMLPPELVEYRIEGDKIVEMNVKTAPEGGLLGLLSSLGMDAPHILHRLLNFRLKGAA